jgi:hypothetical protein
MDRADGRDGFRHNANPNYVMAGCLGLGYRVARDIFISQKAHFTLRSDTPFPISARRERRRGKPQGRRAKGLDNCAKYRSHSSHQANNEVDGEAGAKNYRLADQNRWVKNNTCRISHGFFPTRFRALSKPMQ